MGHLSCSKEKSYYLYLLFWPAFGVRYLLIEQYQPKMGYHPVWCVLDDQIPFLEFFIIPYLLWHICIIGLHIWLCFHDAGAFRCYSRYLIFSMSISTMIFLLYPTCQNLRPEVFPRDNLLTQLVQILYRLDTNTNVCPSEHIIGSVGFYLGACHCKKLQKPDTMFCIAGIAFLTAIATVFLKQHSLIDVAVAVPVSMIGAFFAFPDCKIRHMGCRFRKKMLPDRFSP